MHGHVLLLVAVGVLYGMLVDVGLDVLVGPLDDTSVGVVGDAVVLEVLVEVLAASLDEAVDELVPASLVEVLVASLDDTLSETLADDVEVGVVDDESTLDVVAAVEVDDSTPTSLAPQTSALSLGLPMALLR